MTDECGQMPQPTREHAMLIEGVGEWKVACKFFMGPDAPPMEVQATDSVRGLGGFSTVSQFTCDFMGMPYEGVCQVGFDPIRKKFRSTWLDSMSPHLMVMEGDFDEATKTMTLRGEGPDRQGGTTTYRLEDVAHSPDHRSVKMFMDTPAGEFKNFEMEYRR